MNITEKIRKLCEENGISVRKLEQEVGIANGTIRRWYEQCPAADRLKRVADFFGVSMDSLLDENPINMKHGQISVAQVVTKDMYPYNLAKVILGEDATEVLNPFALMQVVENELVRNEVIVLQLRYKYGWTYKRIAEEYDVLEKRIRQIEARGVRKLRHPSRSHQYLVRSRSEYKENKDLKEEINYLERENRFLRKMANESDALHRKILAFDLGLYEAKLNKLDLSTRALNCLSNNSIETIGQLIDTDSDAIWKFQGIGEKTYQEIKEAIDRTIKKIKYIEEGTD